MRYERLRWELILREAGLPENMWIARWIEEAVQHLLDNRMVVIMGGRKTGRTTAIKILHAVDDLRSQGVDLYHHQEPDGAQDDGARVHE